MALNSYVPGDWFGVVRCGTVVVLGPGTGPDLLDSLWALLGRSPEIHEILNEVTEAFGVSLTRIPAFGIVDAKDALRVVLRGDLDLETAHGTAQSIHGRDVTTWTERRMELPASYRLRIGSAAGTGPATGSLPLQEGVVLLSGLEATLTGGDAPAVPAAVLESENAPEAAKRSPEPAAGKSPETVAVPAVAGVPAAAESATADRPAPVETILAFEPEAVPEPPVPETVAAGEEPEEDDPTPDNAAPDHATPDDAAPDDAAPDDEAHDDLELTIAPGQLRDGTEAVEESQAMEAGVDTGATTDQLVQNLEQTSSYDHLWERTVIRTIEDAAVRVNPDEEEHQEPAPAAQAPEARPQVTEPLEPSPAGKPAPQHPASQPLAPQPPAPQNSGLISSVPWLSGNSAPAAQGSAPQAPAAQPPAPPAPQQWTPPPAPAPAPGTGPGAFASGVGNDDGDHDGHTVMKSSLPDLPSTPAPATPTGAAADLLPDGTKRPLVLARVCPQGHANPPTYSQCPACGSTLSGDGVQVPRPSLGKVRLSSGEVIELDRSLVIGRQPSVSRVQGGGMPALVQVESPGGDISRSHVEVRLEGWHVMLCDLKATNGTVLVREGQAPRRLAQNEMAIVLDGDIAELGENISLRFEEIL
ncbi:FHA domain-containing protein [Arthrobacter celericrescens]|uniref:FHA domain-containing protein n=1 Tax=Arthrobacter celericrescens TaxID=2320851 RepID=UPI000EA07002|nr:FHA domain-containing protein [Arthrobacter celericrescens]